MKIHNTLKLIIAIVLSELAGIIGSFFTAPSIPTWYAGIIKPDINPPAWVFAPVWTTLFAMMGIAAFLVWQKGLDRKDVKIALGIFIVQLILNTLWSIIFFGLRNPGGALIEIVFLWFAIFATIAAFAKISKPAAWLLVPYILWVSFAGFLNYSLWRLNTNQETGVPSCTEGACPEDTENLWKTAADSGTGITFQYPEKFQTEYIHPLDWPPQIHMIPEPFVCTETGEETARAGQTSKQQIGERTYCVTKITEGAAGSTYAQYAYAFPLNKETLIFTFSIRTVQCGNYSEPQKTACEKERTSFDIGAIIDRMAKSIARQKE